MSSGQWGSGNSVVGAGTTERLDCSEFGPRDAWPVMAGRWFSELSRAAGSAQKTKIALVEVSKIGQYLIDFAVAQANPVQQRAGILSGR